MAKKCSCSGSTCGCLVQGTGTVTVTGTGTKVDPYKVSVNLAGLELDDRIVANPNDSITVQVLGTGTAVDPIVISAAFTHPMQRLGALGLKAADQNVTASTVLVAAAGMSSAIDVAKHYKVEGQIFYTAPAAADIKIGFTAPAGATMDWALTGLPATAAAAGDAETGAGVVAIGSTHTRGGVAAKVSAIIDGFLTTDATHAGALALTFAQAVSDAGNVTIHAGSWLRAVPLD